MIQVCGNNSNNLLDSVSNNTEGSYICPPVPSNLNPSIILSYSIQANQSVLIKQDFTILGIGDNSNWQISGSLPKSQISNFTTFTMKDCNNNPLIPISAICCCYCTLYITSQGTSENNPQLDISYSGISQEQPQLLNIGDRHPVALFGD